MTPKSDPTVVQPLNDEQLHGASAGGPDRSALWAEARLVYPVYAAAATQFAFSPLPHPAGELPPNEPTSEIFNRDTKWLDEIDGKIRAFQIRQLPPEILNASEPGLNAFIQRHLRKPDKTKADQDKIDLLLVQYFALCAPARLYRGEIALGDVAQVLQPVLLESDSAPLEWCQPLEEILQQLERCQSLRDLMEEGLVEKGRIVKDSAGCMFYDPAALVAFCRFNFLLRRAFIRLLHADLSAVSQAIEALSAKGVKSADCRRAGFSAAETIARLRNFCENWRQPFQRDYTESSVRQSFEQLLALRTDLEEAFAHFTGPATSSGAATPLEEDAMAMMSEGLLHASVIVESAPVPHGDGDGSFEADALQQNENISGTESLDADMPKSKTRAWGSRECLEAIWGQLKAAPPTHTSSMFTVRIEDTKVLLSSWEGEAFLKPIGEESEDLRRAVVARALVAVAMDRRKRSGEKKDLEASLLLARAEVAYFQARVEQAKSSKNMEAAVNLGISSKRIRSVIEDAEKL